MSFIGIVTESKTELQIRQNLKRKFEKMNLKKTSRIISVLIAVIMVLMTITIPSVSAASYEYPAQLVRISTSDGSRNINITGYSSGTAVNTWTTIEPKSSSSQLLPRWPSRPSMGSPSCSMVYSA